jgi:uncharacterized protein YbjT (DUF2867 family)
MTKVAVTGATGYIGRRLLPALLARGHEVRAIIRPGSERRVIDGIAYTALDVFSERELSNALQGWDTVVHLIGTPHPNPSKAAEFERVDLASIRACVPAAARAGVKSFVYVSVAQPAPVMEAYLAVRAEGERILSATGMAATILRPWYVLGPGHRWPILLVPLYALAELVPSWREGARRLGLVSLEQMVNALVHAVEQPPPSGTQRMLGVPDIRRPRTDLPPPGHRQHTL